MKGMRRRTVLSGLVGMIAARTARAAEHTWQFDVEEVEIHVPDLDPAHDGVVIAQLSDIHVGMHTPDGRVINAVDVVNAKQPDLVVLTGDYVTRKGDPLERVPELLGRLEGQVIAVLGNHDHWTDARTIARDLGGAGIEVLRNQHTVTRLKNVPFTVLGIDDAVSRHADVESTFKGVRAVGSRLVLAHAPPTIEHLPHQSGLVCLSGHTHGGQVYVRGFTEGMFARAGQPYVRGRYDVNGNVLYVNRGLGFGRGGPFPRMSSEPEVTFVTLRRGAPSVTPAT
jgi:predicted MPP superfamily phosphohydrolase